MAIARTINPFTCFRDLRELNDLISTREKLMSVIEDARSWQTRRKYHEQHKGEYDPAFLDYYRRNYEEAMDEVRRWFYEYRCCCEFAHMNIHQATEHRNKIIEYLEDRT